MITRHSVCRLRDARLVLYVAVNSAVHRPLGLITLCVQCLPEQRRPFRNVAVNSAMHRPLGLMAHCVQCLLQQRRPFRYVAVNSLWLLLPSATTDYRSRGDHYSCSQWASRNCSLRRELLRCSLFVLSISRLIFALISLLVLFPLCTWRPGHDISHRIRNQGSIKGGGPLFLCLLAAKLNSFVP